MPDSVKDPGTTTSNNSQSDAPITRATIFPETATITRTWTKTLQPGIHHLRFTNFVQQYLTQSLRVTVHDPAALLDVIVGPSTDQSSAGLSYAERTGARKDLQRQKEDLEAQIMFAEKRLEVWEAYRLVVMGHNAPVPAGSVFKEGAFVDFHDFLWKYEAESARLHALLSETKESLGKICHKLDDLINHIPPLFRSVSDIKIVIEVPAAGAVYVDISYTVQEAGWIPKYDMRFALTAKQVEITYYALVQQWSGEDWTTATVSICSQSCSAINKGNISSSATPPAAKVREPILATRNTLKSSLKHTESRLTPVSREDTSRMGSSETLASSEILEKHVDLPAVSESKNDPPPFLTQLPLGLNINHEKSVRVVLGKFKLETSFWHYLTPQESINAQLTARTKNQSPLSLLSGFVNLYRDGSYIGNTFIKSVSLQEEFRVNLANDPEVEVTVKSPTRTTKPLGATSEGNYNIEEERSNDYLIKNNRKHPITVSVKEPLPKSTDERIKVSAIFPKINKAQLDSGWSKQLLDVPGSSSRNIKTVYKLEYPHSLRNFLNLK